jgi:type IV pilus assembly protein PilV
VLGYNLVAGANPNSLLKPWVLETQQNIPGAVISVAVQPQPAANRAQVNIVIQWQRKANTEPNTHRVTAYVAM